MFFVVTEFDKLRGLRWCYLADSANSIFVGLTLHGPHFVLFLSFLGLSKFGIGTLYSLLPFMGITALVTAPAISRCGYRRTFLIFFGARKLTMASLLCTPIVLSFFGEPVGLVFVVSVVAVYGLCRAIAETALYPWSMEYIPERVRGKFSAVDSLVCALSSLAATVFAAIIFEEFTDITPYMILLLIGVMFGFLSVGAYSQIVGGASVNIVKQGRVEDFKIGQALGNRPFRNFLASYGLMSTVLAPLPSLLPLFYQSQVGLLPSQIVWAQSAMLAGGFSSILFLGKLADRYGGKPVMLLGVVLGGVLPLGWMCLPRQLAASWYFVLTIEGLRGVVSSAWQIGSAHYLFLSVIPQSEKVPMTATFYAVSGLSSGISLVLSGWILDRIPAFSSIKFWFLNIDLYTPLFVYMLAIPIVCYLLLDRRFSNGSRLSSIQL